MDSSITYSEGDVLTPPDLRLLHFNDVYHIDASSAEPVGGIARFQTLSNHYRKDPAYKDQPELITLFSGDAFNPSLESSVTKGSHMVPFLNNLGTNVACVGNHDLDFGVARFQDLASKCTFPWLLANVLDPALGEDVPLGGAKKTVLLTATNGIKVGIIGVVEKEWLDTINTLPPNLIFKSASETAIELAPTLRQQGADIVIAVSHQREPNDNKLAEETPHGLIDIILGGHDHYYQHKIINGTHILRSGTDFKQLSYVEAWRCANSTKWNFHIVRRDVVSSIPEDPVALTLSKKLTSTLKTSLEKPVGFTAAPLDARFTTVRLKESNLGNFVCDIMRSYYDGDCCIMAAGTIRGDQIYPPGVIRAKDIMNCFPFEDPCVVIMISGQAVLEAIENSVSTYPALEGRFPQVSNMKFEFDPNRPPHSRVNWLTIGGQPLQPDKQYKVVTRDYMARGKDGFTSMLYKSDGGQAEEVVSEENGILISMLLRQYFMSLKVLGKWSHWSSHMEASWRDVHNKVHQSHEVMQPKRRSSNHSDSVSGELHDDSDDDSPDSDEAPDAITAEDRQRQLIRKVVRKWWRLTGLSGHPNLCSNIEHSEMTVDWTRAIAPSIEGRIVMIEPIASA